MRPNARTTAKPIALLNLTVCPTGTVSFGFTPLSAPLPATKYFACKLRHDGIEFPCRHRTMLVDANLGISCIFLNKKRQYEIQRNATGRHTIDLMAIFQVNLGQPVAPLIFRTRSLGAKSYGLDALLSVNQQKRNGLPLFYIHCNSR